MTSSDLGTAGVTAAAPGRGPGRAQQMAQRIRRRLLRGPSYVDLHIVELHDPNPVPAPLPGLELRELAPVDERDDIVEQVARTAFYVRTPTDVRQRLADGEHCVVLLRDDEVVSSCWMVSGTYPDAYTGRTLDLGGAAYYLGAHTPDVYRGHNLAGYLIVGAIDLLAAHGLSRHIIGMIRSTNTSSLRMAGKLGITTSGHLHLLQVGAGLRVQWFRGRSHIAAHNGRLRVDVAPLWAH